MTDLLPADREMRAFLARVSFQFAKSAIKQRTLRAEGRNVVSWGERRARQFAHETEAHLNAMRQNEKRKQGNE